MAFIFHHSFRYFLSNQAFSRHLQLELFSFIKFNFMDSNLCNPSKGNILIVDDSPNNLRVLSTTLMECGYEVRCVKSGSMAMIGIQTRMPDLVLLDIRMPEADGYEVCQYIKANPETAEIPIIFLSALDEVLDKVKAFQVGGADYITKPFQIQEVLARVENQLTIRRLQQQLLQKNQHLQQEVNQHQQAEAALRIAKEAAEAASYAKSAFLAQMSHELRTPLNHILGFTELLQKDETLTSIHQDYLDKIYGSGRHLLKLINNILSLTQVENGQLSLNRQDFDLLDFLNKLQSTWQAKLGNRKILFTVEQKSNVPAWIQTDKDKLNQIFESILDNAFNLTAKGKITVRVSAINSPPELKSTEIRPLTLQFEVEGTGSGIVQSELSQLLKTFTQAETDYQSVQGIGLGLPISRQFIQRMGGDIAICSSPGGGTLVSFSIQVLPLVRQEPVATLAVSEPGQVTWPEPDTSSLYNFSLELNSEMLQAAMPQAWINKLHHAAIKGFDHQILQLIQELSPSHIQIAETLRYWTDNFHFDRIIHLTKPIIEKQVMQ